MRNDAHLRTTLRTLAVASLFATAMVARADEPPYYQRLGVYDFDQCWNGLWQQNFGKNHCVPAAYADIFKYMDVNGLSAMSPIPRQNESNYLTAIQNELIRLGNRMDTDPDSGTNAEDAYDYAIEYMADRAPNVLMFNWFFGPDSEWGTGTIQNAVASGSICRIGYGRYYRFEWPLGGGTIWSRDGGHALALVGYDYRNTSHKYLLFNNPNDSNNWDTQSSMLYDFVETVNYSLNTLQYGTVTHARFSLDTGDNNDRRRLIDTMHQIMPAYAAWQDAPVVKMYGSSSLAKSPPPSSFGTVRMVIPWQPIEQRGVVPNQYNFTPKEEMVDWIPGMGSLSAFYATRSGKIYHVNLVSGEQKLLQNLKGAKGLVEGGSTMDLYVLVEGAKNDQVVKVERDDNSVHTVDLPGRATGIEYDPATGGPAVLDANLAQVHSLSENLDRRTTTAIPRVSNGTGAVIFKIDHQSGDFLTARKGSQEFIRAPRLKSFPQAVRGFQSMSLGMTMPIRQALPMHKGITAMTPTENGLILVQDGTNVQTYDRSGVLRKTQFSDLQANGEVKMPRSLFAAKRGSFSSPAMRDRWSEKD